MIKSIIDMLIMDDWLIGDEDINTAKGKYKLPESWKEARLNRKRCQ